MSQQDDDLRALAKIMDFLRAVSILLVVIHLYWYCYEAVRLWGWKSHATLTPLAKQDLPTFGYNMIDPLKSWCWGSILFYPFKISRFS